MNELHMNFMLMVHKNSYILNIYFFKILNFCERNSYYILNMFEKINLKIGKLLMSCLKT